LIKQWMNEILLRVDDDAALKAIHAAGTERDLKRETIDYIARSGGAVKPSEGLTMSGNTLFSKQWPADESRARWKLSKGISRITCRKCPISGDDACAANVNLDVAHG
jgi:hypothetical protein